MDSNCCHSKCFSHNFAALIGRVIIGVIFILAGFQKIVNWQPTVNAVENLGVSVPHIFVLVALTLELLGGVFLILGYKTRFGAFLLVLMIVPATLLFHSFWNASEADYKDAFDAFIRNMFYFAALLIISAFGAGKYSIDAFSCKNSVCATKEHASE
jgi:uncharacterized membrane protein YphA (DoxX/SURF4 family)